MAGAVSQVGTQAVRMKRFLVRLSIHIIIISVSFAGLGFLSFYLAGKLHLFDKKGHTGKAWLSLTPLAGATLVAISRTMDYRRMSLDPLSY